MRTSRRLLSILMCAGLMAGLVASIGCDSDQPLQAGEQTVSITFEGGNSRVPVLNVWDMFLDNDDDNVPDDGQFYMWCTDAFTDAVPPAPISFGIVAEILRDGEIVPEVLTSQAAAEPTANLAGYDPNITEVTLLQAPVTINGDTYKFCQTTGPFATLPLPTGCGLPRRASAVVREVVMATSNPVSDADPMNFGWGSGLCSNGDPGPEMTDGQAGGIDLTISKGDTLIVRMVRGPVPSVLVDDQNNSIFIDPPLLSAIVNLDGSVVAPVGSTTTSSDEGSTVQFSVTSR